MMSYLLRTSSHDANLTRARVVVKMCTIVEQNMAVTMLKACGMFHGALNT